MPGHSEFFVTITLMITKVHCVNGMITKATT